MRVLQAGRERAKIGSVESERGKLTSSGEYIVWTKLRTSSFANSVTWPLGKVAPFSARIELPMLDVRMMVVFLKSTLRP
jgi:hypothetical protein